MIVIIIPISILGIYCYQQSRSLLFEQANNSISNSLRQATDNINYKLGVYNNISDYIAFNNEVLKIEEVDYASYFDMYIDFTNVLDSLFNTLLFTNKDVETISIYSGNNIAKHGTTIIPISSVEHEKWYSETMNNFKLSWHYNNGDLFCVRRLFRKSGKVTKSILYIKIHNNIFNNLEDLMKEPYGVFVTDSKNNILYSKDNITNKNQTIKDTDIINFQGESIKIKGVNYSVSNYSVSNSDWKIHFYMPVNSIPINAKSIGLATVIVIIICLVILLLIIKLFSYIFVNRIEKLTEKVRLVEAGDLKVNVSSNSKDEIGELINSFAHMLKKINELIEEVYVDKITQKEFEMKALQQQINPHFLYNSLSMINSKAIQIDAFDISLIVLRLTKFYRTALNKGNSVISIKDEIENTKAYVEIQAMMHDYSFNVTYKIDEDLYKYHMINIIFQPIVENAIEHGIDLKREGKGDLYISGEVKENNIEFIIEDNGVGMSEDKRNRLLFINSDGYGMKNVNDRIKLFFGDQYGISIYSKVDKGTRIIILLPQYKP